MKKKICFNHIERQPYFFYKILKKDLFWVDIYFSSFVDVVRNWFQKCRFEKKRINKFYFHIQNIFDIDGILQWNIEFTFLM